MSKLDEATAVLEIGRKIKQAANLIIIAEAGTVERLDDGKGHGSQFVGFVLKEDILPDDIGRKKLKELLIDACAYVAGDIQKQVNTKVDSWVDKYKKEAVAEAEAILAEFSKG